ncbi:MAG: hypothetical protein QOG49_1126, partial [Frankiaceae bacterium]|nr:hypothetical protein [Frankiaceae bacterium]
MARSRSLRAFLSGATVITVIGSGIAVSPPAFAAATPAEIAAANALRGAVSGTGGAAPFLDGLTAVGSFATPEPALTLVPSNPRAIGTTPLADALAANSAYATADSPTALKNALNATVTLADGADVPATDTARTATFTSTLVSGTGVDTLHVDVVISRANVTTGIRLHSTTKPIDFSSDKGVVAKPSLHLAFDVVRDDTLGTRIVANPAIAVDTTAVLSSTLTDVDASIGILGVTLGTPPAGT